jgi:hypothetical protein
MNTRVLMTLSSVVRGVAGVALVIYGLLAISFTWLVFGHAAVPPGSR